MTGLQLQTTEEEDETIYVVKGGPTKALRSPSPFVYNTLKQGKGCFLPVFGRLTISWNIPFFLLQLGMQEGREGQKESLYD